MFLFIVFLVLLIMILLILLFFKKKKSENYHINSPGITNCRLVSTIIDRIQTQLNELFNSSNMVGPITITLSNGEVYTGPPLSSFTQSINPSFRFLNASSNTITILNNTWSNITIYEGNSTTSFNLQLNGEQKLLQSGSGYPGCCQAYVKISEFLLNSFFLIGLSNIKIIANSPATCSVISRRTKSSYPIKMYSYDFSFQCLGVEFGCNMSGKGGECTNFCGEKVACISCNCNGSDCCLHNPHQICPPDAETCISFVDITNGYVHLTCTLILPLTLEFTYQIDEQDQAIKITDISITKNTDISWTNINLKFSTGTTIDLGNLILDALGGIPYISNIINGIIDNVVNKLLENVINMLNDILKTETITIN